MVLKHSKFTGVGQSVIGSVFLLQEGVDLSGGELMRVAALHLGDDGVARFDALTVWLTDQISTDDVLSHGHWLRSRVERSKVELASLECFGEGEQAAVLNDELGDRVVLPGEFLERYGRSILEPLRLLYTSLASHEHEAETEQNSSN